MLLGPIKKGLALLSKGLEHVPFINSLLWFPWQAHSAAILKFLILWVLASLPVIVAVLFSPMPQGDGESLLRDIISRFSASISVSEQFVYIASFLTPVLYIFYEKYRDSTASKQGARLAASIKVFHGYGWVFLSSCLLILFTGMAFSSLKSNPDFKSTYLYNFLASYSAAIYFFALYCWYLSLLDSVYKGDYVGATRAEEQDLAQGFAARIKAREVDGDE